ncbi:MAG: antibiotic biosynthesis monooxygenase [Treponema sp.]|nr:antibiotic biosynthesis monooxygenase [Treponema sp.]
MKVVLVRIQVKPGAEEAFLAATLENARASNREPGVARFDVLRDADDPSRFLLVEAYRDEEAPARHKETAHYLKWKETAEPLMAGERTREFYEGVFVPERDPR